MPKYGLPQALTWYSSSESSVFHGAFGVYFFASWSKRARPAEVVAARTISEMQRLKRLTATLRDGSRRVADPFAPGAGVQPRARFAGSFQGEQQIARRDAGAAHDD